MYLNSKERRRLLYEAGAHAVNHLFPQLPRCYICPLCGPAVGFLPAALDKDVLTLDHVPPAVVGKPHILVLTCRDCNSKAGHQLDHHMQTRRAILDFFLGTMPGPSRARLDLGGVMVNVDAQITDKAILIFGLPNNNSPEAQRAFQAELGRMASEGLDHEYRLELRSARGYEERLGLVAGLRAAYLVAFAVFGYRYVFRPELKVVRDQLADPNAQLIRVFSSTIPDAPRGQRRILVLEHPEKSRSVLIQIERQCIYLPYGGDFELYQRLEDQLRRSVRFRLAEGSRARTFGWPRYPLYLFDRPVPPTSS